MRPSQIQTKGLTHIYFAFASINPTSFQIEPAAIEDEELYREFTSLSRGGSALQTWIAIGGSDFSDPGPTHTTWSELVLRPERRAAFIMSVLVFFRQVRLPWR